MVWIWTAYIFLSEVIICFMCCNDCRLLCMSYGQGFSILLCHTINASCVSVFTFLYRVSIIACFPVCVYLCSYMIICAHECGPARVLCGVLAFLLYSNISYHEIKLHLLCFIMECKFCGHDFRYRIGVIWQHCLLRTGCVQSVADIYNLKDTLHTDNLGLKNVVYKDMTLWRVVEIYLHLTWIYCLNF
jgi:hypothetical protein